VLLRLLTGTSSTRSFLRTLVHVIGSEGPVVPICRVGIVVGRAYAAVVPVGDEKDVRQTTLKVAGRCRRQRSLKGARAREWLGKGAHMANVDDER